MNLMKVALFPVLLTSCISLPQDPLTQYYLQESAESDARLAKHLAYSARLQEEAAARNAEWRRLDEKRQEQSPFVEPPTAEERQADALEDIGFQLELDRMEREMHRF